jgi:hypothetical protein
MDEYGVWPTKKVLCRSSRLELQVGKVGRYGVQSVDPVLLCGSEYLYNSGHNAATT